MYLLEWTFILDTLGANEHPAVSKGQLLRSRAAQLLEQSSGFIIHSAKEKLLNRSDVH